MSQILQRIEREMKHRQRTRAQIIVRRVSVIVLLIVIPLLLSELALRLMGFSRPQVDFSAQERLLKQATAALNERFDSNGFEYDQHLFWKLKPGSNLAGLDVDDRGLLSWKRPVWNAQQEKNSVKVLCLGDSVSAVTYRTFPDIAEQLAAEGTTSKTVHFYSAAVPGYSTEQALRRLPQLKHLEPNVVVLCFGWSDHFPALSVPDRELGAANAGLRMLHDLLKDVRLYQLIGAPLGTKPLDDEDAVKQQAVASGSSNKGSFRVSPPQFQANLEELISIVRSWDAVPVLATQPEDLKAYTEQFLQQNDFIAPNGRDNGGLHSQYNDIIRKVAAAQDVPMMDLEEEFVRRPREYMLEPDGIHLTGRGHNHVARLVLNMLKTKSFISEADYDAIARAEKHDTTAPDKPRATWSLIPEHVSAYVNDPVSVTVIPQNSGNTRWLKRHIIPRFGAEKNVSYGSSYLFARWRTVNSPTTGIAHRVEMPGNILPGEATSVTMSIKTPPHAGNYELEIGVGADRIGPLSNYGAETTTLTVTAVER